MAQKRYQKKKLYHLEIAEIRPDPAQPRKHFDSAALEELVASIKSHGIIQPVLVRRAEGGGFMLVSGERRYQACVQGGLTTIPAILTDGDPVEIALVENLLRENLTAVEEAEAIARLKDAHDYTLADLSKALGKAESTLSEILSLMNLPEEIRDDCRNDPKTSRGKLVEISRQPTTSKMKRMYRRVKANGMSLGEIRLSTRPGKHHNAVAAAFIKRFIRRIEVLQPGNLDQEQSGVVLADLELLRTIILAKIKALRVQPNA